MSVFIAAAGLVLWAPAAGAHAAVVTSSPAANQHLHHPPTQVTILFDQPVVPDDGGLTVLDSAGASINSGPGQHPKPDTLTAVLRPNLPNGAYVANYTVTSVDGHIVSGAIVFLVGHASAESIGQLARQQSTPIDLVDKSGQFLIYLGVLGAGGLVFFLAFIFDDGQERKPLRRMVLVGMVMAITGMIITVAAQAALAGGSVPSIDRWYVLRPVLVGGLGRQCLAQLVCLAVCCYSLRAKGQVVRQFTALYGMLGAEAAFVLFGHAVAAPERWMTIPADIVHVVFAALWIGGLIGLVSVLRSRTRLACQSGERRERRAAPAAITSQGASAAAVSRLSASASGPTHADATSGPIASQPKGSSTAVLERPYDTGTARGREGTGATGEPTPRWSVPTEVPDRPEPVLLGTVRIVRQFSTLAGISVGIVIVAGTLLAIGLVGSFSNLVNTTYGRLLLVKIAAVGLILFMAAYNRFLLLPWLLPRREHRVEEPVPQLSSGENGLGDAVVNSRKSGSAAGVLGREWRMLLRTVRVEAACVIIILLLTSVLANSTPGTSAVAAQRPVPFYQVQPFESGSISLRITPNQALVNNFSVRLRDHSGGPFDVQSVSIYFTLPSIGVGPIIVDMKKVGAGLFVLNDTPNPPIIGDWQVTLQVRVSDFAEQDASFVDQVK